MANSERPDQAPAAENGSPEGGPPRRHFLISFFAVVFGTAISLFPFVPGMAVLLDPVLRKRKRMDQGGEEESEFVRVATLDAVPQEGAQQFPVIDDRRDAWNYFPNERVGAVYLRRVGENMVQAFSAVCPHLGCIYSYVDSRNEFYCPCHNSAFNIDGGKIEGGGRINPSPRPLDELEVDQKRLEETGEIWIRFQEFYTGTEEKIPKQ